MPQNVTDVDTFTATVQTAADGDGVNGASRMLTAQDLSDRTRWLHNRNIQSVGGDLLVPLVPVSTFPSGGTVRWVFHNDVGPVLTSWICLATGVDEIIFALPTLHNCTFDDVEVTIEGDCSTGVGPHGGVQPASMPRVSVYSVDLTTAATTLEGQETEPWVDAATYDANHKLRVHNGSATPLAVQTMDPTIAYYVTVRGESGANSIANALALHGMTINVVPA